MILCTEDSPSPIAPLDLFSLRRVRRGRHGTVDGVRADRRVCTPSKAKTYLDGIAEWNGKELVVVKEWDGRHVYGTVIADRTSLILG